MKNQRVTLRCSAMVRDALENFAKFARLCRSLVFVKVTDWMTTTLLKRDSRTGDFLWILRNSQEHLFYRKPAHDCFWKWFRRIFSILTKLQNASFLTRGRLYFNHSYIFAKSSTKIYCFTQSDCYLARFHILPCRIWRRWNKCFQDFSILSILNV